MSLIWMLTYSLAQDMGLILSPRVTRILARANHWFVQWTHGQNIPLIKNKQAEPAGIQTGKQAETGW